MKSKIPPHPQLSGQAAQPVNALWKLVVKLLLIVLVLIFIISASITAWLAFYVYKPQLKTFFEVPTSTVSATATPKCVRSTLSLGPYSYPMDVITTPAAETIPTLAKPAGTAWLLTGTSTPYVFIFVPALGSLDMQAALSIGDELSMQWADCKREDYVLSDFQPGVPDASSLFAQTTPGIAIIIQPVGGKAEYVIYGQLP